MRRSLRGLVDLYNCAIHLQPRSPIPYATHVPILIGLSVLCQPKRIIEFGSGDFSTAMFLNRSLFPSTTEVLSFENNRQWFERIQSTFADSRLDLRFVENDLSTVVSPACVLGDLIFIDDSMSARTRAETIVAVARSCCRQVPVVIHDAEQWRYRLAMRNFRHSYAFENFNPQTAIAWNGTTRFRALFDRLKKAIRRNAELIPSNDPVAWRLMIERELLHTTVSKPI
jgi:hypothetical protein